jgi:hypothetical protein
MSVAEQDAEMLFSLRRSPSGTPSVTLKMLEIACGKTTLQNNAG